MGALSSSVFFGVTTFEYWPAAFGPLAPNAKISKADIAMLVVSQAGARIFAGAAVLNLRVL